MKIGGKGENQFIKHFCVLYGYKLIILRKEKKPNERSTIPIPTL